MRTLFIRNVKYTVFLVLLLLCITPAIISAQEDNDETCPQLVSLAIESANDICQDIGRNQACYGNVLIDATPQESAESFVFSDTGDVADVADIQSLALAGMNTSTNEWGVAIMRIQANIPETLPGQNVTFVLFGDVEIEDASTQVEGEFGAMQAFYLRSGVGDSACAEAPNSGILVQTPEGVADIALNVNGVDIALGSTAFLQAQSPEDETLGELRISLLEGNSTVSANDGSQALLPGEWLTVAYDEDFMPVGEPNEPEPEDADNIMSLPITLLERQFDLPELNVSGEINGSGTLDVIPLNGTWTTSGIQMIAGEGCPTEMVQGLTMAQGMGLFDVSTTFEMDWTALLNGNVEDAASIVSIALAGDDTGMMGAMLGEIDTESNVLPDMTITYEGNIIQMQGTLDGTELLYQYIIESETLINISSTFSADIGCPLTVMMIMEYQG